MHAMKQVSKKQLTEHINLVKWEEGKKVQKYSLVTIHSLLLNANPKFIELKKIIEDFNHQVTRGVDRKHLKEEYVKKLYSMLSQMILIPVFENQQKFLNQVYDWAVNRDGSGDLGQSQSGGSKSRPTTASTRRTRPFSAYSRPMSGSRANVGLLKREEDELRPTNTENRAVDYSKLKPGEVEFYNGMRTLHEAEEKPKKQLSQYRRKVFYDEEVDSDLEVVDLKQEKLKVKKQTITQNDEHLLQQVKEPGIGQELPEKKEDEEGPAAEGEEQAIDQQLGEEEIGDAQDDANIDDLPMDGEAAEEEAEVVDKLKPRIRGYINHETELSKNTISYNRGVHEVYQERSSFNRKKQEDAIMREQMAEWARDKSRAKREQKRRAESARILTQKIGISKEPTGKQGENLNVINFESIHVSETKPIRPKTGFNSTNLANRQELISKCFVNSKLATHINPFDTTANDNQRYGRVCSVAERPKKKTFEEILRDAENKVKGEQMDEIINVKQTFAKNKVAFESNRIAKSITCHTATDKFEDEPELTGVITGMSMINNPFFKAGKKKKKKKKSKK